MKNRYLPHLMDRNPSQLTPWYSQTISTPINPQNLNLQKIPQFRTITKMSFPRVTNLQPRSSQKLQKIQYHFSKKQILPSDKTFENIKTAKQTAFNGFITKYKMNNKPRNKRYFIIRQDETLNSSFQPSKKIKFINFNSIQSEDETLDFQQQSKYQSKQIQFSRKRSLSNIIKSLGKDKIVRLKQPCLHSPWMLTSCVSKEKSKQKQDKEIEKTQRNIKLVQLNLGIRQRNFSNSKASKY